MGGIVYHWEVALEKLRRGFATAWRIRVEVYLRSLSEAEASCEAATSIVSFNEDFRSDDGNGDGSDDPWPHYRKANSYLRMAATKYVPIRRAGMTFNAYPIQIVYLP